MTAGPAEADAAETGPTASDLLQVLADDSNRMDWEPFTLAPRPHWTSGLGQHQCL